MINAFIKLFVEADALFYILFVLAMALLVAEAVVPSFGLLGLGGILSTFGSIVARCVVGDNTSLEIFLFVVYILAFILLAIIITKIINKVRIKITQKSRYAVVDGVKVPLTKEGNLDYSFLLGKEGVVVSDLKPLGKIKIDDQIFEATTSKGYIYTGTVVKVDKIMAQRIVVKKKG